VGFEQISTLASQGRDFSCAGNLAHGVVEGETEYFDKEVDGVAGEIALRPAPVAFFDDEAGKGGQDEIARIARDQLEILFFEQRRKWSEPCGADLFARGRFQD